MGGQLSPESSESEIEPGGPMTPEKLRVIAGWLEILDIMARKYIELVADRISVEEGHLAQALAGLDRTEVQDDLRRWADEMECSG